MAKRNETPESELNLLDDEGKEHTRYVGHLAEFPAFHFGKRLSGDKHTDIEFRDTIKGPSGEQVTRHWVTHPSRFGLGGATTQAMLFDLNQMWRRDAFQSRRIEFGSLNSLYQIRHPGKYPSKKDYDRMVRDMRILCGTSFDCENAFWDPEVKQYQNMYEWHFFTAWSGQKNYHKAQIPLEFGFIEVSDTLFRIAKNKGLFVTGFDSLFFHKLKPLEQRIALYLSKMFVSQTVHRRSLDMLYAALPIEVKPSDDKRTMDHRLRRARQTLKEALQGLIDKDYPNLKYFEIAKNREGTWMATFHRRARVRQDRLLTPQGVDGLDLEQLQLVEDIELLTGDKGSTRLWANAIRALGINAMRMAYSELKGSMTEQGRKKKILKPAAVLTAEIQKIARERGIRMFRETHDDLKRR